MIILYTHQNMIYQMVKIILEGIYLLGENIEFIKKNFISILIDYIFLLIMKILIVHNNYGKYSGEEAVVDKMADMLMSHGHEVAFYRRTTEGVRESAVGKIKGFLSGIYSSSGCEYAGSCDGTSRYCECAQSVSVYQSGCTFRV